jgi:hypothetical protein
MPRLNRNGVKPSRFKIIPLDAETGNKPMPLSAPIQTRSEYVSLLAAAAMAGQKVAIQDECGTYLSCRTKFVPTNSAFAEYRKTIGEYERFQVEHCLAQGTYSFRSHNGLYLHFNKQMGTIAFQSRTMEEATWMVHPLGLGGAVGDRNGEHIVFCGVADKNGEFLIHRTTEGVGPEWKTDLQQIIETIVQDLPDGSSSIFQHPVTNHQWCVAKYDAEKIAIVVSSEQFPQGLAVECHDDLTLLYKNSSDPKKLQRIEKQGLDKDRIIGKELAGLMMEYDEQYYLATRNSKLSKVEQEMQELQNRMGETIQQLQSNVEDTELLVSKTNELLEMSKLFKKQTEKLPTGWKRATILVGTGLGAGTGALAGWLIGGPGGAMVLSTQGMEIGAGAIAAGLLGGSVASTTTVSFWSRRFVRFIFPNSKSR